MNSTSLPRDIAATFGVLIAMVTASVPIAQLTSDQRALPMMLTAVALLCGLAMGLRWRRIGNGITNALQAGVVLGGAVVGAAMLGGASGLTRWISQLSALIRTGSAPLPPDDWSMFVLVLVAAVLTVLTDVLFVTAWSPVAAGLPLLLAYLTPAALLDDGRQWAWFLFGGFGWLLLLGLGAWGQSRAWSRGVAAPTGTRSSRALGVGQRFGVSMAVGVAALAAALAVGSMLPTWTSSPWQLGNGEQGAPLQLRDPKIDLAQNLARPDNPELLTYTTTAPAGVHLRLTSLPVLQAGNWQPEGVRLIHGQPSDVPGLGDVRADVSTTVAVRDFDSPYLAAPWAPRRFRAEGRWGYDPVSLMIYNTVPGSTGIKGLTYSVQSADVAPNADELGAAMAGVPADDPNAIAPPEAAPASIVALARAITATATTDGEKAVALENYLSDPQRFSYDLRAPGGQDYQTLELFLTRDNRGYCVHFASAMAVMARALGIPSRVAIGFLPGERDGDTWVVRAHDMHAWPELFFGDLGWVRFEPTVGNPSPSQTGEPQPTPGASPQTQNAEPPLAVESANVDYTPTPGPPPDAADMLGRALRAPVLLLALLLALISTPLGLRTWRRHRRMRVLGGTAAASARHRADAAWWEIRDTALDLHLDWPQGSVRVQANALERQVSPASVSALQRVAILVEQARYASWEPDPRSVAEDTRAVRSGLMAQAPWHARLAAVVWPASLFSQPHPRQRTGYQSRARRRTGYQSRARRRTGKHEA